MTISAKRNSRNLIGFAILVIAVLPPRAPAFLKGKSSHARLAEETAGRE